MNSSQFFDFFNSLFLKKDCIGLIFSDTDFFCLEDVFSSCYSIPFLIQSCSNSCFLLLAPVICPLFVFTYLFFPCCWSCSCSFPWSVCCSFRVPKVHFFCFCTSLFISSLDLFYFFVLLGVFPLFSWTCSCPSYFSPIFIFSFLVPLLFSYSSFSPSWYYCCSCSCVVPKCS